MSSFGRTLNEIQVFFLDAHGQIDKLKVLLVISVGFSIVSMGIFSATFLQSRLADQSDRSQVPKKVLTIDERAQALAQLSSTQTNTGTSSTSSPVKKGLTEQEKMDILKKLSQQ